jgi:hypothetical protein
MPAFMVFFLILVLIPQDCLFAEESLLRIANIQNSLRDKPVGERIALWAESFVGKPYDPDPLGEYVRKEVIVADERMDCMYHTFRSVELALSTSSEGAIKEALRLRFFTKGIFKDGKVINYEDRYQYGEDMIDSGKWGNEITSDLGKVIEIKGSRGKVKVSILSKEKAINRDTLKKFKDGDIIYFIKDPDKRVVGEIVGHIGIVKLENNTPYLIHASGAKNEKNKRSDAGTVRKVKFLDYLKDMRFAGIRVTRF